MNVTFCYWVEQSQELIVLHLQAHTHNVYACFSDTLVRQKKILT